MKSRILGAIGAFVFSIGLVAQVQAAAIAQMTITDVDNDGLAGCFKFDSLDASTCAGGAQFSSDGSVSAGDAIPGVSVDGAILFGQAQGVNGFSQGFDFAGFPMKPITLAAPIGDITGSSMTLGSFPFAVSYQSGNPMTIPMSPDGGTLVAQILNDNGDNTFDYLMTWSHLVTAVDDPTGAFTNFPAFWRLEGAATVVPVPAAVWLFGSGLLGLIGMARRKKA